MIYSCDEVYSLFVLSITDSAFKKIKILQEASLEHHPTTVSCPTPARRRHRTTFTQVVSTATLDYIVCWLVARNRIISERISWKEIIA